jgi:hypothetical protein
MGLLDNLENQALGNVLGGSSNPLASGLLQMILRCLGLPMWRIITLTASAVLVQSSRESS